MTATTTPIESLTNWSEPKRVSTAKGPRNLRTGPATDFFWNAWRSAKETLKSAGVSVSKDDRSGNWQACWWLPVSETERKETAAAVEASKAESADIDIPAPAGLEYLPFQKAGIAYAMNRPNVLIADEMGLGKSIQTIGIFNADPSIKKVLIICPATLRLNWKQEFIKWAVRPVKVAVVNGGKPTDFPKDDYEVLVVNYDVVSKHKKAIDAVAWDMLVSDEAQALRNPKAIRTKAVLGTVARGKRTAEGIKARRKVFLTGTPIVNRPVELWPLVEALDPTGLGRNFFAFAKKFCDAQQTQWGWDFTGASRLGELQIELRSKFMVRRWKSDVLKDLPAKRRQVIEIPANGATGIVGKERDAQERIDAEIDALQAAVELAKASDSETEYEEAVARLGKAQSAAFTEMSAVRHETALAKIPYVVEHLKDALESGPVIVFAHHKDVIAALLAEFPAAVSITGDTAMEARQKAVDDFQAGKADLFVGNIIAAGTGITLTRSSHVVFAELSWVPGELSQAEDRAHRIGQNEKVLVQHLVLEGSLDAVMARRIVAKQEVIDRALDRKVETDVFGKDEKERPTTVEIKREEIAAEAATINQEKAAAVLTALRMLAGRCDGAQALDGAGFNKFDARIGHDLAARSTLTPKQAALGLRLTHKYGRQLPEALRAVLAA